MAFAKGS